MARGGGGGGRPPAAGRKSTTSMVAPMREEWEVEYSRFFNFPNPSCYSFYSLSLKLLPRCKSRSGGTWINASAPAALRLVRSHAGGVAVLSVSGPGIVYEEHFISNMNISWPQVSCVSECPIRGSRVLFFSFRDCSSQIHKFAVRFSTPTDVQTFLDTAKENSRDIIDGEVSDSERETSMSSEILSSNGIRHSFEEESNFGEPMPAALTFHDAEAECSEMPLSNDGDANSSVLPPSFTELLNNCSTVSAKGLSKPDKDDFSSQNGSCLLDSYPNASVTEMMNALEKSVAEIPVSAEIIKYASDSSFHELLAKIEGVIAELGDDMSL